MTGKRHSKSSWIEAGFRVLVADGAIALRAEPMAKTLNTTKGSFYWHFADVPAFHQALVEDWRNTTLGNIVTQLSSTGSSENRLREFGRQICADDIAPAMRAWAKSNPLIAQHIEQIDEQHLKYISTLLTNLGVGNPAFALACYATLVGAPLIQSADTTEQAFTALIDLILALK